VRVDLGVNSAMGGGAEWVWDCLPCNSGSTGGSRGEFWLCGWISGSILAEVGCTEWVGMCRVVILALRVDLRVNSGSAGGTGVEFWPRGEAQNGCGSARLVILVLRVDLGLNSGLRVEAQTRWGCAAL
jgi:hypothetical protein